MAPIDYENRPLPSRAPRGWRKAWRRIDSALLFVRRLMIWLAIGLFIFAPLRPGWCTYVR